jgi:hypothetical protein
MCLVTVWCLGCSGYEPLLDSLLGGNTGGMVCDGGMAMAATPTAATASSTDQLIVTLSPPANTRDFDCGCGGSCHAPSLALGVVAPRVAPILTVEQSQPSAPASISRTPLLPPPESIA